MLEIATTEFLKSLYARQRPTAPPTKPIDPFAWSRAEELAARYSKKRCSTSDHTLPFPKPKGPNAELVEIIEARLARNEFLFEPAPELTATAEAIVQKLRSREMVQSADEALMGDTANVQLDSLEMDNGRSVGCERPALGAIESLCLSKALKEIGMTDRDARITMAMVIARMVHPSSERAALNWLETNSATLELLCLDTGKGLKLDKLYRLSDVQVKHHRTTEDAVFARQRKLFGTSGAMIFYDLTNTHMTGRPVSKLASIIVS